MSAWEGPSLACPTCEPDPAWGHASACPTWLAECSRRSAEDLERARSDARERVFRIIESYSGCMDDEDYIRACADDVLNDVLGWPVTYAAAGHPDTHGDAAPAAVEAEPALTPDAADPPTTAKARTDAPDDPREDASCDEHEE